MGEKGSKMSGIYCTVVLRYITRGPFLSCLSQFQIKDQVGKAGDGAHDSFALFGSRGRDYRRKKSGRKPIWTVNGDGI
jgi:hypothetical protein